jgi:hypothetical protein
LFVWSCRNFAVRRNISQDGVRLALTEKAREKYPERLRKRIRIGVIRKKKQSNVGLI